MDFSFVEGVGPRIHHPLRNPQDAEKLREGDPEVELRFVADTVSLARQDLDPDKALIGFAGAPFTLASYIIEGGHSRNYLETKSFMYSYPDSWKLLMEVLTRVTIRYLEMQVRAG